MRGEHKREKEGASERRTAIGEADGRREALYKIMITVVSNQKQTQMAKDKTP